MQVFVPKVLNRAIGSRNVDAHRLTIEQYQEFIYDCSDNWIYVINVIRRRRTILVCMVLLNVLVVIVEPFGYIYVSSNKKKNTQQERKKMQKAKYHSE